MRAGKRLAICDSLWIEHVTFGYLVVKATDKIPDELTDLEDEENSEELERAKRQAQLMYERLPVQLREHVATGWF